MWIQYSKNNNRMKWIHWIHWIHSIWRAGRKRMGSSCTHNSTYPPAACKSLSRMPSTSKDSLHSLAHASRFALPRGTTTPNNPQWESSPDWVWQDWEPRRGETKADHRSVSSWSKWPRKADLSTEKQTIQKLRATERIHAALLPRWRSWTR